MTHVLRRLKLHLVSQRFWTPATRMRESIIQHTGTPADLSMPTRLPTLTHAVQYSVSCHLCTSKSNLDLPRSNSRKEHRREWNRKILSLAVGLGTSSTISYLVYRWLRKDSSSTLSLLPSVFAKSMSGGGHRSSFNFIADVVERAMPASVFIEIQGRHPFSTKPIKLSQGSGFLVRHDGAILTNAHVVRNRSEVVVTLHNGKKYVGHVVAVDNTSDLAYVKIDAKNLPFLHLGNSSTLRPGEWVIAVGSPLSLSNTVTAGIISSVHRGGKELGIHSNMDYIQTDAQITFGNSGGALVNLDGEAVGINTMKITAGISFAIPSDYARNFLEAVEKGLREKGKTSVGYVSAGERHHFMGVTMLTLTPRIIGELQERLSGFPSNVDHGVFIHQVAPQSPAQMAGLKSGDIIVAINGNKVKSTEDVYSVLRTGQTMQVSVQRGNSTLLFKVVPQPIE